MADAKALYNKMKTVVGNQIGDKGTEFIGQCLLAGCALIAEAIRNSTEFDDPSVVQKECKSCHRLLDESCKNPQCKEYSPQTPK